MIVVQPDDFWPLVLSAVRYTLGRSSYAVGWASSDLLDRYGSHLTTDQLRQLEREIREALRFAEYDGRTLGGRCDHRAWQRAVVSLGMMVAARQGREATECRG